MTLNLSPEEEPLIKRVEDLGVGVGMPGRGKACAMPLG